MDEYYVGLLMLCVLELVEIFRSGAMMNLPELYTQEISRCI